MKNGRSLNRAGASCYLGERTVSLESRPSRPSLSLPSARPSPRPSRNRTGPSLLRKPPRGAPPDSWRALPLPLPFELFGPRPEYLAGPSLKSRSETNLAVSNLDLTPRLGAVNAIKCVPLDSECDWAETRDAAEAVPEEPLLLTASFSSRCIRSAFSLWCCATCA